MGAVGTKPHHARSLAEVLVEGDHRGHYSHGLNRMGQWAALVPLKGDVLCCFNAN